MKASKRPGPSWRLRSAGAQILLGWALKMDARGVMEVVYDGIASGSERAGKTPADWRKTRAARSLSQSEEESR